MKVMIKQDSLNQQSHLQPLQRPQTSKYSSMSRRHIRTKSQMRNTATNWGKDNIREEQFSPGLKRNGTLQKKNSSSLLKIKQNPIKDNAKGLKIDNFKIGMTLEQYMASKLEIQPFQTTQGQYFDAAQDLGVFKQNFMIDQKQEDEWDTKQTPQSNIFSGNKRLNQQLIDEMRETKRQTIQERKNFIIRNINNIWKDKDQLKQKSIKKQDNNSMKQQRLKSIRKISGVDFYKNIHHKIINFAQFQGTQEYLMKKYGNKFNLNKQAFRSTNNDFKKSDRINNNNNKLRDSDQNKLKIKK